MSCVNLCVHIPTVCEDYPLALEAFLLWSMPLRAERLPPGKVALLVLLFHVGSASVEQAGPTTHRRPPAASTHACSRKSLLTRYSSQLHLND